MATNFSRKGFDLIGYRNAAAFNGAMNLYYIASGDSTATFVGDLLIATDASATASTADLAYGVPLVAQAAAGASTDINAGVAISFNQHLGISNANLNVKRLHRPASVGMYVLVSDDPNAVYSLQSDDVGETANTDYVGANGDIIVAAGSTVTGRSGMLLDISTIETTATLPLKVVGIVNSGNNSMVSGDLNIKYKVVLNAHTRNTGTLGMDD